MPSVDFLCLANSIKHGGRCVAGLLMDGTGWVRPVSALSDGTLTREYLLEDRTEVALLDVVRVTVKEQSPRPHQPENWILADAPWRRLRTLTAREALPYVEPFLVRGPILLDSETDRIRYEELREDHATASLAAVEPQSIQWHITQSYRGTRQVRCYFNLGGRWYDLVVTDPVFKDKVGNLEYGQYERHRAAGISSDDRVFLTISLGEPFERDDCCYKLVAAVWAYPP